MPFTITDIIQNSDYSLEIFKPEELADLDFTDKKGKPYLKDFADGKERPAKPEEVVRQLYIHRLIHHYGYPASRIAVEKGVWFGSSIAEKRADIVVHDEKNPDEVYLIVECKNIASEIVWVSLSNFGKADKNDKRRNQCINGSCSW